MRWGQGGYGTCTARGGAGERAGMAARRTPRRPPAYADMFSFAQKNKWTEEGGGVAVRSVRCRALRWGAFCSCFSVLPFPWLCVLRFSCERLGVRSPVVVVGGGGRTLFCRITPGGDDFALPRVFALRVACLRFVCVVCGKGPQLSPRARTRVHVCCHVYYFSLCVLCMHMCVRANHEGEGRNPRWCFTMSFPPSRGRTSSVEVCFFL